MDESPTENRPAQRTAAEPVAASGAGAYKPVIIVLFLLVIALVVGLWVRHSNAEKQKVEFEKQITLLSNQVVQATADITEAKQVNSSLEASLAQQTEAAARLTNLLNQTTANLARTEAEAKEAAATAAKAMAERDKRIQDLEGQRDDLTRRMAELNGNISSLESQIEETQRKLATSEGDRAFLLKELKRMQQEKMELEKQFNDLAMLRDQVRKLKDELSVSKRLDWLRRGLYGTPKGAEKLQRPLTAGTNKFDLNVELKQDKSVIINPPSTNAPPK